MVLLNNVSMVYENSGMVAANGIDLEICDGEFVFLVGPSGSGKTTIIKLLTGEVKPTDGEIYVNNFNLCMIKSRKLPRLRRTLGVIFQDFRLIDDKSVYENVAFAMRVVGASNKEIKQRVPYVLELVGLEGREKRLPQELSGGKQQRVAIARAMVKKPSLVLADEPTANLDAANSHNILQTMLNLNRELKTTFIFATHDEKVIGYLKRKIFLKDGLVDHEEWINQ